MLRKQVYIKCHKRTGGQEEILYKTAASKAVGMSSESEDRIRRDQHQRADGGQREGGRGQEGKRSRHGGVMSLKPQGRKDKRSQCAAAEWHTSTLSCLLFSITVNSDTSDLQVCTTCGFLPLPFIHIPGLRQSS